MKGRMKGKTKRFLSLLTIAALLIGQIPSAFADEVPEETTPKTLDHISINYTGGEQYVGSFIDAKDVYITAYYTDGTSEEVGNEQGKIVNRVSNPQVLDEGWNDFSVVYGGDAIGTASTDLKVWGYRVKDFTTTYKGSDVYVGSDYDTNQVEAMLIYTDHSDGTPHVEYKSYGEYTLSSTRVLNAGTNTYTSSIETREGTKTSSISVWGYELKSLNATYNGEAVKVNENYKKSDVSVKATYTEYSNGQAHEETPDFTLDSMTIKEVGANTFTAKTSLGDAKFTVVGYEAQLPKIVSISAKYIGKDKRVGSFVSANEIEITVAYDNNTTVNMGSVCTVENVKEENKAPIVTKVGWNDFTVHYKESDQDYTTTLQVWGYDIDHIEAVYSGPYILTNTDYSKNNVHVTAYWTERKDGTPRGWVPESFTVNETLVKNVGENSYTAYAENKEANFTVIGYDDRFYAVGIVAEYVGPDILVGKTYAKEDVKVWHVDANGKKSAEQITDFVLSGVDVTTDGNNEYTVTVGEYNTEINVWGYKPSYIEASYNGKNIFVGNDIDRSDVSVTLYYTKHSNGDVDTEAVNIDNCNFDTTISAVKYNELTVSYNELSDKIQVWGYKYDHISAVYNGENIRINNHYNKDDVEVTAYYTTRIDDGETSIDVTDFTVSDTLVKVVDANNYKANWNNMQASFIVNGFDDNVYVESITAKYNGPDILVGENYNISDIEVTIKYTNNETSIITSGFTVNSTNVEKVGYTTYTVTYNEKTAEVQVWGYAPNAIKAEYVGPDILVGNMFYSKDVEVVLTYTPYHDNTIKTEVLPINQYTIVNKEGKPDPTVYDIKWNDYTVKYRDLTDGIKVWGYKVSGIDAEYIGPNIFVGNTIKSSDIIVNLTYTPFSNGTIKTDPVNITECGVRAAVESAGLKVWKVEGNEYIVSYNGYDDTISVWGYKYDHIVAEYNGNDVRIREDYNISDVDVTAYYTPRTDGGATYEIAKEFDVNSTFVVVVGANTYTATYKEMTDNFTVNGFDDGIYAKSMKAKYVGPDILVGNTFNSSDVIVTVTYTDGSTRDIENGFEITPFEDGIGPIVVKRGWNEYTVTYDDMTDEIQVWGYEPDRIEAEYVGPDILVGNMFYSKDVNVDLVYSPYHDGTYKIERLDPDNYTIVNNESVPNPTVTDIEWNYYTVTYKGLSDVIKVWGYKLDRLEAVYNGPAIYVGNNYDKADVTVTAIFTPYHTGAIEKINVEEFDVDSLLVIAVGSNTYMADCEYGEAPFVVPGIEKEVVMLNNIFTIVAVDKNGNNVNGVSVKYSTNGYQGTLETGKVNSVELGIGTIVTKEDCTIVVPNKYEIDTTTMNVATGIQNTIYTLTIVVKDAPNNTEIEKTANIIKLVAVDTNGNNVNGVSLTYSTNGYKGTLKTGETVAHEIGIGTVITLDDCTIGIPSGYTFKSSNMTSETDKAHTVYTATITLTKNADEKPSTPPCNCDPTNPKDNNGDGKCDCGGSGCNCNKKNDTPVNIPQTGDESDTMLYMTVGGLALVGILGLLVTKKKEEEDEE